MRNEAAAHKDYGSDRIYVAQLPDSVENEHLPRVAGCRLFIQRIKTDRDKAVSFDDPRHFVGALYVPRSDDELKIWKSDF